MLVTGIDACKGGWVAVTLAPSGARVTVAAALGDLPMEGVTGIDMPLGLLADGWRTADLLARRALGRRGSCVFAIPPLLHASMPVTSMVTIPAFPASLSSYPWLTP